MEGRITLGLEFDYVRKEVERIRNFLTETFGTKFTDFQRNNLPVNIERHPIQPDTTVNYRSKSSNSGRNHESVHVESYKDPFRDPLDQGSNGDAPVAPSTTTLSAYTSSDTTNSSGYFDSITLPTVPIPKSSTVSVSPLPATLPVLTGRLQFSSDDEDVVKRKSKNPPQLCSKEKQSVLALTKGPPLSKTGGNFGQFHLRGRTFYHKPIRISDRTFKVAEPCASRPLPPTVGIASMEGNTSPPKRPRPPSLPSFKNKNRSLTLQSSEPLKKVSEAPTAANASNGQEEIIQCDLCNLFVYSTQVESHMQNHALVEGTSERISPMLKKPKICPLCSVECVDYDAYEIHISGNHPTAGFPCPICVRRMSCRSKLRRHMAIHRNLKFECTICGKAYNRNDNLTAHYKTHKSNEKVTIFYCSRCTMAFASMDGRNKHISEAHSEEYLRSLYHDDQQTDEEQEEEEEEEIEVKVESPNIEFEYEGDDDI